jgi:hypothetical protein
MGASAFFSFLNMIAQTGEKARGDCPALATAIQQKILIVSIG